MSTFNAIQTAFSGIRAQQAAMEVASQNVANVNTPGYHRQEAVLQAREAFGGVVGSGVDVTTVRRLQDQFLQQQSRLAEGQVGYWSTAHGYLQQVEGVLAPGTDLDLSTMFDQFFNAWQQLADHPEEPSRSDGVRSAAIDLTTTLNSTASKLDALTSELGDSLGSDVTQINTLADKLATLNAQIGAAKAVGTAPNDLLDQREAVLDELASLGGVTSLSTDEGTSIVSLGGRSLVQGSNAHHLDVRQGSSGAMVVWAEDGAQANITSGAMASLVELRDKIIPGYKDQLDAMAYALASAVNTLHRNGVTLDNTAAGDFFSGTTAAGIRVHDDILADSTNIAASRLAGAPGDGGLANEIYALYQQPLVGSQTLNQHAQSLLGQIGHAVRSAEINTDANTAVQQQLYTQEQAVSGVSIDEELTNLITSQRAYDASARVFSIADEMLKTLIERMG